MCVCMHYSAAPPALFSLATLPAHTLWSMAVIFQLESHWTIVWPKIFMPSWRKS